MRKPKFNVSLIFKTRLRFGLSLAEFGERVGQAMNPPCVVPPTSVWRWENGLCTPRLKFMPAIMKVAGIKRLDDLYKMNGGR